MELLIGLLVLALVAYLAFLVIGQMSLPAPVSLIVRVIVGVLILLHVLNLLGPMVLK